MTSAWALLALAVAAATVVTAVSRQPTADAGSAGCTRAVWVVTACCALVVTSGIALAATTASGPAVRPLTAGVLAGVAAAAVLGTAAVAAGRRGVALLAPAALLAALAYPMKVRLCEAGLVAPRREALLLAAACALFVLVAAIAHSHLLQRHATAIAVVGTTLLLLPFLPGIGRTKHGARAWATLPGIGEVQPGEFARVLLVVATAAYVVGVSRDLAAVGRWHRRLVAVRPLLVAVAAPAVAVLLLVAQRDLGPALVLSVSVAVVVWLGSGRVRYLALALGGLAVGCLAVYPVLPYLHHRVALWRDPMALDGSGQLQQPGLARSAMTWAGWVGGGLGHGPAARTPGAIPASTSDYVLAQFGAELGIAYVVVLLAVLAVWLLRCWRVALEAPSGFPAVSAAGMACLLSVQTMLIAAGVISLAPLTGLTTPLLSAGGSSGIAVALLLGILVRTPTAVLPALRPGNAGLAARAAAGPDGTRLPGPTASPRRPPWVALPTPALRRLARRRYAARAVAGTPAVLRRIDHPTRTRLGACVVTVALVLGLVAAAFMALPGDTAVATASVNPQRTWARATGRGRILGGDGAVLAWTQDVDVFDRAVRRYDRRWGGGSVVDATGWAMPLGSASGVEQAWGAALRCGAVPASDDTAGTHGPVSEGPAVGAGCRRADVRLTVHGRWQEAARSSLGGFTGAVVVLDLDTAAVLASVSTPGLDPNTLAGPTPHDAFTTYDELHRTQPAALTRAATGATYPPGSTFKVVTAQAALAGGRDAGLPVLDELPLGDGQVLGGVAGRCGRSIQEGLAVSCNPAFGWLGERVGRPALFAAGQRAGLGDAEVSGIPLAPAQLEARMPFSGPAVHLGAGDGVPVAITAIGQGEVRLTPMHLAEVAARVGSGGLARRPYLVAAVQRDGHPLWTARPTARRVWSQADNDVIAKGMRLAVQGPGTATRLAQVPGGWAAKTGTAETGLGRRAAPASDGDARAGNLGWLIAYSGQPVAGHRVATAILTVPPPGGHCTGQTAIGVLAGMVARVRTAKEGSSR